MNRICKYARCRAYAFGAVAHQIDCGPKQGFGFGECGVLFHGLTSYWIGNGIGIGFWFFCCMRKRLAFTLFFSYNDCVTILHFYRTQSRQQSSLTAGSKQLTVKWKKGSSITGYEIQYSLKSTFKSAKKVTISKASTTKTILKNLTANKTYYVRVRTYKTVKGKKYYSAWSKAKSAKTTK